MFLGWILFICILLCNTAFSMIWSRMYEWSTKYPIKHKKVITICSNYKVAFDTELSLIFLPSLQLIYSIAINKYGFARKNIKSPCKFQQPINREMSDDYVWYVSWQFMIHWWTMLAKIGLLLCNQDHGKVGLPISYWKY